MDDLLLNIGMLIKAIRKKKELTISTFAENAGVSNGLVSRIENGRTIPSLPVLLRLIDALDVEVSTFFEGVEGATNSKYILLRSDEQKVIEKEVDAKGFSYFHIFSKALDAVGFEAVILVLSPHSEREVVRTDAWEFKYVLKGSCIYFIDNEEVSLQEGDAIYFNGRYPHVPVNKTDSDCVMLVLYLFTEGN